jgi:Raf kinase inhibitor-like YbhB/YbcL family protein
MALSLRSLAFDTNSTIPKRYTCDGENISPPLSWAGLPPDTKSLVLIVDDPDAPDPMAPQRTWVHWVLYNIPVQSFGLPENVTLPQLPAGTREGLNDWQRTGYGGPCPPIGRHRYFHHLYALDTFLRDMRNPTKSQIEAAMQGHILEHTALVGLYQR